MPIELNPYIAQWNLGCLTHPLSFRMAISISMLKSGFSTKVLLPKSLSKVQRDYIDTKTSPFLPLVMLTLPPHLHWAPPPTFHLTSFKTSPLTSPDMRQLYLKACEATWHGWKIVWEISSPSLVFGYIIGMIKWTPCETHMRVSDILLLLVQIRWFTCLKAQMCEVKVTLDTIAIKSCRSLLYITRGFCSAKSINCGVTFRNYA